MNDEQRYGTSTQAPPKGGISPAAALGALVGAIVLAFLFVGLVGFPANIPLAFGCAVVAAELVDGAIRLGRAGLAGRRIAVALLHGAVTAAACWLGVWIAGLLG